MTNMIKILLLPIIFALLLITCLSQTKDFQKKTTSDVVITISLQDCECTGYSAQIYGNGTVIFDDGMSQRKRRYNIPAQKVRELVEEFYRINYFSLRDEYKQTPSVGSGTIVVDLGTIVVDLGTIVTSISIDGKKKRVVNGGNAPLELNELEKKIEETADYLKYTFNILKWRFENFNNALIENPTAEGLIINYGTVRNIAKRIARIKVNINFRQADTNRIKFAKHIRRSGIRTEFKVIADGKTTNF